MRTAKATGTTRSMIDPDEALGLMVIIAVAIGMRWMGIGVAHP